MTHTYAVLKVSRQSYEEIRAKLAKAGYEDQFDRIGDFNEEVIDMHGIALKVQSAAELLAEKLAEPVEPVSHDPAFGVT